MGTTIKCQIGLTRKCSFQKLQMRKDKIHSNEDVKQEYNWLNFITITVKNICIINLSPSLILRLSFNPIGYGLKEQFLKMFSSIAAHRFVQTEWKFERIIICIYRSDCNRKKFKKFFWLAEIKVFLEAARNLKIFKNHFFSHSSSDLNFWPKSF